jgi:solute carrier family 25 citrate transporter 1
VDAARVIAREEGARGLFRGYWAQNFVWWPWSAAYFAIYERCRVAMEMDGGEASPIVSAVSATAAATAATTLTHPLDLAKTRLQTMRFETASSSSLWGVLRDVLKREGARGLFAGVGARIAAVAPGSAISFGVYETLKQSGW